jgi:hypothetical protein
MLLKGYIPSSSRGVNRLRGQGSSGFYPPLDYYRRVPLEGGFETIRLWHTALERVIDA